MIFLKNVPVIGDMYIEKILFEFDKIPIIFVSIDTQGNRYMCICNDCIDSYNWIFTKTTIKTLIDVIKDEIAIFDTFKKTQDKVFVVNKNNETYSYKSYDLNNIPEDELPDENEKLENPNLKDYLEKLNFEEFYINFEKFYISERNKLYISEQKKLKEKISVICQKTEFGENFFIDLINLPEKVDLKRKPKKTFSPIIDLPIYKYNYEIKEVYKNDIFIKNKKINNKPMAFNKIIYINNNKVIV